MVPIPRRSASQVWKWATLTALCAVLALLLHVKPVKVQAAVYVSDAYGNVVYDNGTVAVSYTHLTLPTRSTV